jgi:hypothetical protein
MLFDRIICSKSINFNTFMKYSVDTTIDQATMLMDVSTDLSEECQSNSEFWQVGQLVMLSEPGYSNPVGSIGVVYQVDSDDLQTTHVAIILESGEDCNLIPLGDALYSFVSIGREEFDYEFLSPNSLMSDFTRGIFTPLLLIAQRLRNAHG